MLGGFLVFSVVSRIKLAWRSSVAVVFEEINARIEAGRFFLRKAGFYLFLLSDRTLSAGH